MSIRNLFLFALVLSIAASCNSKPDKKDDQVVNPRDLPSPSTGETINKEQQLNILITESRKTLDSIDAAYQNIALERENSRGMDMYDKEQINEALMELNDAKDLIVLETQQRVISELKEKTASLQSVMQKMNTASAKMQNIVRTVSRISSIIEKTTNTLAMALTSGIIRPPLPPTTTKPSTTTGTAPSTVKS